MVSDVMPARTRRRRWLGALALSSLWGAPVAAEPFDVYELPSEGRVVAAEVFDSDGTGANELLCIVFRGYPPDERRLIRVYGLDDRGVPEATPRFERPLEAGAAAYDLADLDPAPGTELLLLTGQGVRVLSLASAAAKPATLRVPGGGTIAAAPDERGLDRLRLAWPELGPPGEPWLLVPRLGELFALASDGRALGPIDTGARANYLILPRPGPVFVESDVQLYLDHPHIEVGDVDGDGRTDLLASTRHELRVFLQRADGGLGPAPDRRLALRRVSPEDHLRGSGGLRTLAADLDGDGRMDLVLSHTAGSLVNASFETSVFRNHGAPDFWKLDQPERVISTESGWGTDELVDLDADGRPELVRVVLPFSVLELIETLVTRALDARISVFRADGANLLGEAPWLERKFGVPISFESGRPLGFVSNASVDLDGDGRRDLLASEGDSGVVVRRFGPGDEPFEGGALRQELPSNGRIRFGDLDVDDRTDAVLYDPREPGSPLRVLLNRIDPPTSLRAAPGPGGASRAVSPDPP